MLLRFKVTYKFGDGNFLIGKYGRGSKGVSIQHCGRQLKQCKRDSINEDKYDGSNHILDENDGDFLNEKVSIRL